jgi:predicted transcriptional regulator
MPDTNTFPQVIVRDTDPSLMVLTAQVAAAYLGGNSTQIADIQRAIAAIQQSLAAITDPPTTAVSESQLLTPAVPVKKSVHPDYIICLEDGKKLKMLKRHLATRYNLTPEEYRAKWGLPADYPMVSPAYAKSRSELAKGFGLGRKQKAA